MSETRRKRLAKVLEPLVSLSRFTAAQAKQVCSESTPMYVTKTLGELVKAGVLEVVVEEHEKHFCWKPQPQPFEPNTWINSRIHGNQVTSMPAQQRPRERLLESGAEQLTNADLLAILVRVGVVGESAIEASQKLANRFEGQLDQLRRHGTAELKKISKAITVVSYSQIMAGIELGRRVAKAEGEIQRVTTRITSTKSAVDYCQAEFAHLANDGVQEEFHIVTLDTKHKPLRTHRITVGTLDASLVHPREVFRPAIRDSASAILLVHNHPSGDATPSREDHAVTDRLTKSGELLGINVLDHIIVARDGALSLRESN